MNNEHEHQPASLETKGDHRMSRKAKCITAIVVLSLAALAVAFLLSSPWGKKPKDVPATTTADQQALTFSNQVSQVAELVTNMASNLAKTSGELSELVTNQVVISNQMETLRVETQKLSEQITNMDNSVANNSSELSRLSTNQIATSKQIKQLEAIQVETQTVIANLAKASSELSRLISSNQAAVSYRLDSIASNNATIRGEIRGIVKNEVAEAMKNFQQPPTPTNAVPPKFWWKTITWSFR